jgi:hypothetical protein
MPVVKGKLLKIFFFLGVLMTVIMMTYFTFGSGSLRLNRKLLLAVKNGNKFVFFKTFIS